MIVIDTNQKLKKPSQKYNVTFGFISLFKGAIHFLVQ